MFYINMQPLYKIQTWSRYTGQGTDISSRSRSSKGKLHFIGPHRRWQSLCTFVVLCKETIFFSSSPRYLLSIYLFIDRINNIRTPKFHLGAMCIMRSIEVAALFEYANGYVSSFPHLNTDINKFWQNARKETIANIALRIGTYEYVYLLIRVLWTRMYNERSSVY